MQVREYLVKLSSRLNYNDSNLIIPLNKTTMKIHFKDKPLDLTVAEFGVLKLFLMNRGIVFSREQILDNVEGMNWSSGDRSIDVIISRLRTKLGDNPKSPSYFESVRGIGYRMMQGE